MTTICYCRKNPCECPEETEERYPIKARVQVTAGPAAGKLGTVLDSKGGRTCVLVDDDKPWTAWCPAKDLVPVRDVATTYGEETPEQRWRETTTHRMGWLEQRFEALWGRQRQLEQRLDGHEREPADDEPEPFDDAALVRPWCELPEELREGILGWIGWWHSESVPLLSARQALADAAGQIPALARRLQQQAASITAAVAALADGKGDELIGLAERRMRERNGIADTLADYYHAVNEALGYDGADGPAPEQALIDIEAARRQADAKERPPVAVLQAYEGLHQTAHQWWIAFEAWKWNGPDEPGNERGEILSCAEENLHDALQALDELGVVPGEPPDEGPEPDDTAPPPSDAGLTVLQLAEQLEQERTALADVLRRDDPDWHPDGTPLAERVASRLAELQESVAWHAADGTRLQERVRAAAGTANLDQAFERLDQRGQQSGWPELRGIRLRLHQILHVHSGSHRQLLDAVEQKLTRAMEPGQVAIPLEHLERYQELHRQAGAVEQRLCDREFSAAMEELYDAGIIIGLGGPERSRR